MSEKYIEDIKIDGKLQRVFLLDGDESSERFIYVPFNLVHRVDYENLRVAIEKKPRGVGFLEFLSEHLLPNGRHALVTFDKIINVAVKSENGEFVRMKKSDEIKPSTYKVSAGTTLTDADVTRIVSEQTTDLKAAIIGKMDEAAAAKRPGPKPKPRTA